MTGLSGSIVIVSGADPVPPSFVALIVKVIRAGDTGVPEIRPVAVSRLRPFAGRPAAPYDVGRLVAVI
jgi:hypothetical protein